MGLVTLIYGDEIEKMVRDLMAKTGVIDTLRPADTVLIKPNLVVSRQNWTGVNTDPGVVEALVKELKTRGVSRITIGDGSGMGYSATKAFDICGYRDMARRYGLRLIDLERDRFVKRRVLIEGPFKDLEISRAAIDCDFLINVPVMKAHLQTLITCSLKNLKGVMSRKMKTAFHGADLNRAIAQLASVVSPELIVVDGLRGNLSSESGRTPVSMETILLGDNPVEVDSVVADRLGYAPRDIRYIAHSADAGLGTCDLGEIRIRSLNRPTKNETYVPPPPYSERFPCHIHADGACCTCMGNLVFALERLNEQGLLSKKQSFLVGQIPKKPTTHKKGTIAVGQCAAKASKADVNINECPPTARTIYQRVLSTFPDK
jgi:uncharacterized protein (DUF362 family)